MFLVIEGDVKNQAHQVVKYYSRIFEVADDSAEYTAKVRDDYREYMEGGIPILNLPSVTGYESDFTYDSHDEASKAYLQQQKEDKKNNKVDVDSHWSPSEHLHGGNER
jgi:hypothetical protein